MRPSGTGSALMQVKQRYPTFDVLATAFNPSIGALLLSNIEKVYSDKAPTFAVVSEVYGIDSAVWWVKTQVMSIDVYNTTKQDADEKDVIELSKLIVRGYPHIRLTEFALFVARFKLGLYGKFYGAFDPLTVSEAFGKFLYQRRHEFERAERMRIQREIEESRAIVRNSIPDGYTSLSWYKELQERARNGDADAIEELKPPKR